MEQENKSWREVFEIHYRAFRDIRKVCPRLFPVILLKEILEAVSPYVTIFFSARILEELAGNRRTDEVWKWVFWTVVCEGILVLLNLVFRQWYEMQMEDFHFRKEKLFTDKLFSMDFADIDKQETHDLRSRIKINEQYWDWGLKSVPEKLGQIIRAAVSILTAFSLTLSLFTLPVTKRGKAWEILNNPLLILGLLGIMALLYFAVKYLQEILNKCWEVVNDDLNLSNILAGSMSGIGEKGDQAVDVRMYNQQDIVDVCLRQDTFFTPSGKMAAIFRGKGGVCAGMADGMSAIFTGFIYGFTCLKALGGAFGVGLVIQYVAAATKMTTNVSELIRVYTELKTNALFLEETYKFLDIPNEMYQGSLTTEKRSDRKYQVEFKDVSFCYPGSENWSLRHVNIKFKVGERLAIVGENGSGKTTFIKLLCRLYDPQEGQILLNGIDIRKYNYRDYMDIFSVVFQDFQLISQSLGANVAGKQEYDREKVKGALTDAGFVERLKTMKDGLDTILYREFAKDGVMVSGGEAQKIAIARALYKDAPFTILDEPTAALDPIAEAEIYSKFNDIAGDKTAIYISHRLSSCKFCDEIAVFHEGQIIQQGSHEKLLNEENGKYSKLWNAQAQYYKEEK